MNFNNNHDEILKKLSGISSQKNIEIMASFGVETDNCLGVKISDLREIAKDIGENHSLAEELWKSGIHEARILASMVDSPGKVTEEQLEDWVKDFDSWDICDQVCNNLFRKTEYAEDKALEWSQRSEEFVKRAGFALMAYMATHRKDEDNDLFLDFLDRCREEAGDERKYVKKAISWTVRNIGKRGEELREKAVELAEELKESDEKSVRWVGKDILRKMFR